MNLLEELQERVVCGDGAMGTLLLDQGLPMEACLEEISVSDPERVRSIHRDYIAAGARVIETNSFGANAARLARFGFEDRVAEINKAAARIAVELARLGLAAQAGRLHHQALWQHREHGKLHSSLSRDRYCGCRDLAIQYRKSAHRQRKTDGHECG